MKKIVLLFLVVILTLAFCIPSAAAKEFGANAENPKISVQKLPAGAKPPVMDGVVNGFEYAEVILTSDMMSYLSTVDEDIAELKTRPLKCYATYDANYLYFALQTGAKDFMQTETLEALYKMYCLQFTFTPVTNNDKAVFSTYHYAARKDGEQLYYLRNDPNNLKFEAVAGTDYYVKLDNDVLTYELRIPVKHLEFDSLKEGLQFRMNFVNNVGQGDGKTRQIEFSKGRASDTSSLTFGIVTLTGEYSLPEVKTSAPASGAAAPATRDSIFSCGLAIAFSLTLAAAAFVILKKRTI